MMKKLFAILTAVVLVLSMASVMFTGSAASTKADLLELIKNDPDVSKFQHLVDTVVNQMDNIDLTPAQCEYLETKFYELKEIVNNYGGFTTDKAHEFPKQARDEVVALVEETASELGYTCAIVSKSREFHENDVLLRIYDASGRIVIEYDGDYVQFTDSVAENSGNSVAYIALGACAVLLAAAVLFTVKGNKKLDAVND